MSSAAKHPNGPGKASAGTGQPAPASASSERDAPVWVVSYPDLQPYRPLWDLQKALWRRRVDGLIPDVLLLLEHNPVVTLGRNARRENLLLPEQLFEQRGVDLLEVDRGGDVTYHGPGQLIGYWIFDLRRLYQDVHRFVREIEEVLIRSLDHFGIRAGRGQGATGVWVPVDPEGEEKIAAMGLHLSHWVSTHGFALNRTTDLAPFGWIVPCGLSGRRVTSMQRILQREVPRAELERKLLEEVQAVFHRKPHRLQPHELADIMTMLERGEAAPSPAGSGSR